MVILMTKPNKVIGNFDHKGLFGIRNIFNVIHENEERLLVNTLRTRL